MEKSLLVFKALSCIHEQEKVHLFDIVLLLNRRRKKPVNDDRGCRYNRVDIFKRQLHCSYLIS